MRKLKASVLIGFLCMDGATVAPSQATPRHAEFLARFAGTWTGGGTVFTDEDIGPIKVNCKVTGKPSGSRMTLAGTCTAALIFSRAIGAEIALTSDGRFVGTYSGSRIGAARLSGRANGNSINLLTTWPKDVFGDTKSNMTLTNGGNGSFSMIMTDKVGGKMVRTTNVKFQRNA